MKAFPTTATMNPTNCPPRAPQMTPIPSIITLTRMKRRSTDQKWRLTMLRLSLTAWRTAASPTKMASSAKKR